MTRKYNIIIFGATGFTGKYVVETVLKTLKDPNAERFTWAVSARSNEKLDAILEEASQATGMDIKGVDKVIADVGNEESLKKMARQCDVVVNCVGPYRFFGEQVVKACVEESTNIVDVSGEPQFLEKMQLMYHQEAERKGIYIVGSCGMDSIPADCGVVFLQQNFEGEVNSIEEYVEVQNTSNDPTVIHYGTWQSAIHGIAHAKELRELRKKLFPERLPKPKFPMLKRSVLHFNEIVNGWCLPFPGSDRSVIMRSQNYFYNEEKRRPIQLQAYAKMSSWMAAMMTICGAVMFGVLAQFRCGRYLLEKFPRFFSVGLVNHDGPTRVSMENTNFSFTLVADGWSEELLDPADNHTDPPNKKMTVKVSGTNPGYGATCVCILLAGLTILKESHKMPSNGGVYPPGAAFARTGLIDRLNKNGVHFSIEK